MVLWSLLLFHNLLYSVPGLGLGASNPIDIISTNTFSGFPCNGSIIFQCTVNGSRRDSTVWKGTAFSGCDDIILLHLNFSRAANTSEPLQKQCDNGYMILIGRSVIRVENKSYTSQLEVLVKPGHDEIPLKKFSIKCVHDNGSAEIDIGSITINTSVVCMSSEILNYSAVNHTTALKESQDLRAIISSGLTLLFVIPVLSIAVPLLLYGLYKKLWSHDAAGRTPRDSLQCQVINYDKVSGCTEIVKTFDNESTMGIYSLSKEAVYGLAEPNFNGDRDSEGETLSSNRSLKHGLLCALRGQVSSNWYSFGLALGVPKQFLNQLKDYSDEESLVEVLDYWLKHHPGKPTWQEIMEAKNTIIAS